VTFVLAFGLTVSAVFSVWRFTSQDTADFATNHLELKPAYAAFDANREAQSILAIR